MKQKLEKDRPGDAAGRTGRGHLRMVARMALFALSLCVLGGLFIVAPPVAFTVAGIWAIYLAAEQRSGHRRALARLESAARERERRLQERLEALSDEIFLLRDREGRYRSLIEKQNDIVFRRDGEGRVLFVNEAFCRMFGLEAGRIIGMPLPLRVVEGEIPELAPGRARRLSYDVRLQTAEGPRWIAFEDVVVGDEAGAPCEVQYVGRDVTGRYAAQETLHRAREEAEAAAVAQSRFLATMSHEIRTPLNGVLGMTGLLERTRLSPEQHSYLSAIRSSGEALLTLIDDILDFSRLDAGKVKLASGPLEPGTVCEEVVELMAPKAHAKALEIGLYVAPEAAGRFEGDSARLRQVILNLVGNAVKFTETGGISVRVDAPHGNDLAIEVADTGPGIPPEAHKNIFKEFEQAETGPARRYGGTGLGLAISARLIRLMRGRISVRNNQERGATFRIELPLKRIAGARQPASHGIMPHVALWTTLAHEPPLWQEALAAHGFSVEAFDGYALPEDKGALSRAEVLIFDTCVLNRFPAVLERMTARRIVALRPDERREVLPQQAALPVDGFLIRPVRADALMQLVHPERLLGTNVPLKGVRHSAASARVLVAEDNDINALLTEKLLESMGCDVLRVADGLEAVEAAVSGRFDLILMDLHMPHMDGLEAASMLTEGGAGTSDVPPIVALTANTGSEERARSFAAGMVDFIVKPVSPETLRATLTRWVWEHGPGGAVSAGKR